MKVSLSLPKRPTALLMVGVLDIVVLLLVFFILVTEASQESGVMVSSAESRFRLSGYEMPVVVTARAGVDSVVYIGRERVARDEFAGRLEEIAGQAGADTVILRIDKGASVAVERGIVEEALALGLRVALAGSNPGTEKNGASLAPGSSPAE